MQVKFQNQIIDTSSFPLVVFKDGITWQTPEGFTVGFNFDNALSTDTETADKERADITNRLMFTYWDALANNHTCFDVEFELNKILAIKNGYNNIKEEEG